MYRVNLRGYSRSTNEVFKTYSDVNCETKESARAMALENASTSSYITEWIVHSINAIK